MTTAYIDIIIRIEKDGTIKDTPRGEKGNVSPVYSDGFVPKPIKASEPIPNIVIDLVTVSTESGLNRFENLKKDNEKIIAGSEYALEIISQKMQDKNVVINPDTHPELIQSLNFLYGDGNHDNKITFAMYKDLMSVIYQYGRYKAIGAS